MMTQQLRADVLSAPLAAIDRRALSQAWYSALGFAHERAPAAAARGEAAVPHRCRTPAREISSRPGAVPAGRGVLRLCPPLAGTRDAGAAAASPERRATRASLGSAIVRRFARTAPAPVRATFAYDGGRVHVFLRCRGNEVRLIALCSPRARVAVARALEEARYALAARGISLGVEAVETGRSR